MYNPTTTWRTRVATFKFDGCGGPATPDFSMSANPASLTLNRGGSANTTVTVQSFVGFTGSVTLSASGLPAGVTVTLNPSSVSPPSNGTVTSTATVQTSASTPTGTVTFFINGNSGSLSHSAPVSLTVNAG